MGLKKTCKSESLPVGKTEVLFFLYRNYDIMFLMKTPGEKSFLIKLYMVIFLSFCVLAGLVYLFILHLPDMNKSDTAAAKEPAVTASAETTRTPEVSSTPSASPSVSPSSVPSASPAVTSEPVPSSPSSLNTNQAKYDISTDSSLYRIVDKKHTIDASYVPDDLVVVNVNMYQQQRLRRPLRVEYPQKQRAGSRQQFHSLYRHQQGFDHLSRRRPHLHHDDLAQLRWLAQSHPQQVFDLGTQSHQVREPPPAQHDV